MRNSRVVASRSSAEVIGFSLSSDLTRKLAAHEGCNVAIMVGDSHLFLRRARPYDNSVVMTYLRGRRLCFNIRQAFLPYIEVPQKTISLPHRWADRMVLQIDLAPLENKSLLQRTA